MKLKVKWTPEPPKHRFKVGDVIKFVDPSSFFSNYLFGKTRIGMIVNIIQNNPFSPIYKVLSDNIHPEEIYEVNIDEKIL